MTPSDTNASMHDRAIQQFWSWFEGIAEVLAERFEDEALLDELHRRVRAIGDIWWEIGPGVHETCALTLTPDGDVNRLALTQRAVAMAPSIPGWELHPARPKKSWKLRFTLQTAGGRVEIDASTWRYVLFRYPDDMFDVVLEQPGLDTLTDEDRYTAAIIVLDAELGEVTRLRTIAGVEPTVKLEESIATRANPIEVLAQHIASLSARSE